MVTYVQANGSIGGSEAGDLKSGNDWLVAPELNMDYFGFSALPAGTRLIDGTYSPVRDSTFWWTTIEGDTDSNNPAKADAYGVLEVSGAINFGATPIEGYLEGEIDFSYNKED